MEYHNICTMGKWFWVLILVEPVMCSFLLGFCSIASSPCALVFDVAPCCCKVFTETFRSMIEDGMKSNRSHNM